MRELRGFQSLIGRLQTVPEGKHSISYAWFQSLIGRLQTTTQRAWAWGGGGEFQSLIGRLQT